MLCKKNTCHINLGLLSSYRTELMGIAALLIIICHAPVYEVSMPGSLAKILGTLGCGVDIFLFLSGMGMYNSYSNHLKKGSSLLQWWSKRYLRIIVPCLLIIIPIKCWNPSHTPVDWGNLLLEFSGFGLGISPLWFVTSILFLYLITPIISFVLRGKHRTWLCVGLSLFCFVIAYPPHSLNESLAFMVQRWPSYLLGWALANAIKESKDVSIWLAVVSPLVAYVLLYFLNHRYGFHFSLFWLQGISLMMICAKLLEYMATQRRLLAFFAFMGVLSLESYVTNEYVIRSLYYFSWEVAGVFINPGNYTLYIGGTFLCIGVSYMVNKVAKAILK